MLGHYDYHPIKKQDEAKDIYSKDLLDRIKKLQDAILLACSLLCNEESENSKKAYEALYKSLEQ